MEIGPSGQLLNSKFACSYLCDFEPTLISCGFSLTFIRIVHIVVVRKDQKFTNAETSRQHRYIKGSVWKHSVHNFAYQPIFCDIHAGRNLMPCENYLAKLPYKILQLHWSQCKAFMIGTFVALCVDKSCRLYIRRDCATFKLNRIDRNYWIFLFISWLQVK